MFLTHILHYGCEKMCTYNFGLLHNPHCTYFPYRGAGYLHIKYDDHIQDFCCFFWPSSRGYLLFDVLSHVNAENYDEDLLYFYWVNSIGDG